MKETEYIIGIYGQLDYFSLDGSYFILYLLDEKGLLEKEEAIKLYKDRFAYEGAENFGDQVIGPFNSVESVNQYAFALCEEFNAGKISLLSVKEYNNLLEGTQQASDFHRDLLEKGNVIENIDRKKKGGLLGRLFS